MFPEMLILQIRGGGINHPDVRVEIEECPFFLMTMGYGVWLDSR